MERQALILSQVHDSIITTDLTGTIQDWNHGAERITGYLAEEAIGKHIALLYFDEDRGSIDERVLSPLRQLGQLQLEMRNRHKSGQEIYLRLSLSLLRDESGQPSGMVGVATDITEQKLADKALHESEERYRSLAEAMPQIAYTTGPDGKTQFVNHHWQTYSGLTPDSCQDFNWMNWIHPGDADALMALWMESINRGQPFQAEYRLRGRDRGYRWQLGRALPVRDGSGQVGQWVGTVTDIHDRKVAEEALAQSEERFRLAVLAFEGVLYDWDVAANSVHRIGDLESLIGAAPDAADSSQQWWADRIHPDDRECVNAAIHGMLNSSRNTVDLEYRLHHANGAWIHVSDRGYAVRADDGTLVRVVGSMCDITARKELELELKSTNERLARQSRVFHIITEAIIAADGAQCVTYCNPAAERLYGVHQADIIGRPLSALGGYRWLKPEDGDRASTELKSRGTWSGDSIHVLNNGSQVIVNSTVTLLPPELGGGTVAVIRDVTASKAAELELEKRAAQLARANQDLLHFAYAVSHDLQTPLRTISNFSQLLALSHQGKLGPEGNDYIDWIVGAANRMDIMLRDLVTFAQAAGSDIDPRKQVDLEAALAAALDILRGQIDESQAVVEHDPLPTIQGDAGQCSALFQNLIGNSLKYRKAGCSPVIRISAERTGDTYQISVRDNGIGFEPRYADRIFGVFRRLHSHEYAGTGVGLALCRRIVERMGGRIWAHGEPGQGSIFTFSIPVGGDVSGTPPAEISPAPAEPGSEQRYLDELFQILDCAQAIVRKLDGTISLWTARSEHIFGWSKTEALGANADQLLGTQYPVPRKEIEAALLREARWSGELKKRRKDGATVWLASQWLLHRDGSGRPESILEVYTDITELKSMQRDLKWTLERFEAALEASPVVVFTQNLDLRYTWIHNPALGYSPGEVIGSSESDLFERAEDVARLVEIKRAAIESGTPRREAVQILDHGALKWFDLSVTPQLENGKIVGIIGTAIDITDRK